MALISQRGKGEKRCTSSKVILDNKCVAEFVRPCTEGSKVTSCTRPHMTLHVWVQVRCKPEFKGRHTCPESALPWCMPKVLVKSRRNEALKPGLKVRGRFPASRS